MKRKLLAIVAMMLALSMALTACGREKDPDPTGSGGSVTETGKPEQTPGGEGKAVKVAVLGSKAGSSGFTDEGIAGADRARAELDAEVDYIECEENTAYETNGRFLSESGEYDLIVLVSSYANDLVALFCDDYKMRVTGINKTASVVAGIRTNKMYFLAAFLSGAFAGLGGAGLVMGVYHRFMDGITSGVGFIGVSVAALAAYSPLAVPVSGALFGMLSAATTTLSRTTDAPLEIMDIIQGLVVVFVSAPRIVTSLKDWRIFKPLKRAFRKPGKEAA